MSNHQWLQVNGATGFLLRLVQNMENFWLICTLYKICTMDEEDVHKGKYQHSHYVTVYMYL